ncbi:MAG: MerR family transcriptional regulator [Crocinitomicaceae bacterium]|nr:MerR family transcriptional regulator [Crocinitomicaceae bacterium]
MIRYSIKDLENYTEIKAHTIRIWEQRYNLLSPKRTESNIRYYSHKDLKKILNINLLYLNGLKISKIAKLSEEEITEKAKEIIIDKSVSGNEDVDTLLIAITSMDADEIRRLVWRFDEEYGLREMYGTVISPLLIKMGELWQTNSIGIAHEHHFSNILRDFLILKINGITPTKRISRKVMLFLPQHEDHELSLLYYQYLLKEAGYQCIYLGKNVPLYDLEKSIAQVKPDLIITNLITRIEEKRVVPFFDELVKTCKGSEIRIAGAFSKELLKIIPPSIKVISSEEELLKI